MKLINQNDYPELRYRSEDSLTGEISITNVKDSGCGICCGKMLSDFFGEPLSLSEVIELAVDHHASIDCSINIKRLGQTLSKRLNLVFSRTDKKEELLRCLDEGGCAIVNTGGDYEDHLGFFSHIGHFVLVWKHEGNEIFVLDPGLSDNKYDEAHRKNRCLIKEECVLCDVSCLMEDIRNRQSPIYLFRRRNMETSVKEIFDTIDKLNDEYIRYWKEVTEIESPTSCKEGIDRVGRYFIDKAARECWDIEVQKNEEAGDIICITMNAGATKKKPIVISGHMDTVHPLGSMKTYIEGDKLYGPGCTDCKGGLLICLLAMKALKQCGYTDREIRFVLQSDEEVGSRYSKMKNIDFMVEKGKDAVAFLNTESYQDGTAVLTRKGIRRYTMRVRGKAVHSSICTEGRNAILEMSYKIIELEKMKQPDDITVNVGVIRGGTAPNTVADECEIDIDVRFNDEAQMLEADRFIRSIAVKTFVEGTSTSLELLNTRIYMDKRQANFDLLDKMNEVFRQCGLSELKARKATGGSDAAFTSAADIPTIDSIGASGGFIHSPKEYANLRSLNENAKRIAAVIYMLKE